MEIDELKTLISNNAFNKSYYNVCIPLKRYMENIMFYTDYDNENKSLEEEWKTFFEKSVPVFQRDNNKWSEKMQVSFIENIIKGCKAQPIMLYTIKNDLSDAYILDGLQRVTAIYNFLIGNIKVFGNYTYDELVNEKIIYHGITLPLRKYNFNTEREVVEFYIQMNENITHSKEDIEKAKKYLETLI